MTTRARRAESRVPCRSGRRRGTTSRSRDSEARSSIASTRRSPPTTWRGPSFYDEGTLLIEFARGVGDGFRTSLERFRPDILSRAAILYIQVSFEESFRRNSARYKPGQEESILFHKVPDRDMLGFFRDNDWADITAGAPDGWLALAGVRVPFVSMNNEPESTDPLVLRVRYAGALGRLMDLYRTR